MAVRADKLPLVFWVLMRWTGHVTVRKGWQWAGLADFDLGVIELFFTISDVFSVPIKNVWS